MRGHVLQCRIKMGAIDAAALGPFVKYAHGMGDKFFLLFSVFSSLRTAGWLRCHGGASQQAAA